MWPKTSDLIGKFITNKYAFLDSPHNNLQSEVSVQNFFFDKFITKSFKKVSITFSMSVHMWKLLNHWASNHEIWHWQGLSTEYWQVWCGYNCTTKHNFILRPTYASAHISIKTHLTPWMLRMCYQVRFITRSVKCMVTMWWVTARLGNGFGCSMKDERTCMMKREVGIHLWWMMIWGVRSTKECVTTDVSQFLICPRTFFRFQGLYPMTWKMQCRSG